MLQNIKHLVLLIILTTLPDYPADIATSANYSDINPPSSLHILQHLFPLSISSSVFSNKLSRMSRNDYYYSHPRSYADSYSSGYPTSVVRRPEKTESIVESSRRDYYPADDYDYHHSPRRSRTSMHRSHSVGDRSAYYGDGSYREGRHRRSRREFSLSLSHWIVI